MEVISLQNHIIRKGLQLSLNEMAVLCSIKKMCTKKSLDYWCVQPNDEMAKYLDLEKTTVYRAIKSLELRGYIECERGKCRTSEFIQEIDSSEEIFISIKTDNSTFLAGKVQEYLGEIITPKLQNAILNNDSKLQNAILKLQKAILPPIIPIYIKEEVKEKESDEKKSLIENFENLTPTQIQNLALEEKKERKEKKVALKKEKKEFVPPSEQDMIEYFQFNGYKKETAILAFKYYSNLDWFDSKGNKIASWKNKCLSVWFREENKEIVKSAKTFDYDKYRT